ncbi:NADH-quinone oxidoreductase subunit N [Phytoactinopolyspora halotolerans]|uniref:NADH-quinone oxidoreductase subunit N n=2 Tax=Phytoactinopolyspora halotolerans TaxID=1981512 RepID=A0A6L9S9X8_9ACTN|nr:NADH-quinone oxidoreductase subunit N [Phytoactinopolyspora halotolerans]
MVDPLVLLPEFLLLAGALAALLLGLWTPRDRQRRAAVIAVVACVASAVATAGALPGGTETAFHHTWIVDGTTGVTRLVVAAALIAAVVLCRSAFAHHDRETEAYVLVLLAGIGAIALSASADLLVLLASYLLASIPLYALVGFAKDARGVEATLKYYLMSALVGVLMLLGAATLMLAAGQTRYDTLEASLPQAPTGVVALGALAVLAGMAFKAGAVPMHFWLPDAAAGASPAAAAVITTVPKVGALAAAFRLVDMPFADVDANVPVLVAAIAAASMTLGNLAAFGQTEVLRLLAYSSISQVGYVLMAVAVAARSDLADAGLAVYLAAYAVANVGAFAAAAVAPRARTISEWAASAARSRWLVLSLTVCLLSLVGTPPTGVFVGKLAVFTAAGDGGFGWLVVLAAVNTVASLFYYLRWIAPAFTQHTASAASSAADVTPADVTPANVTPAQSAPAAVVHVTAAGSVVLGVLSGLWLATTVG